MKNKELFLVSLKKQLENRKLRRTAVLFFLIAATIGFSETVYAEKGEIAIDEQHFPDEVFREYIQQKFDKDANNSLSVEELEAAKSIDFMWGEYWVTDMTGIEYFTSLESLNCSSVGITSLDLQNNQKLTYLDCTYNTELTSLDISHNTELEELHCYETGISELSVSNNPDLRRLDCNHTPVSNLDVSKNPRLFALNCENTNVSSLDLSHNPELYEVYVTDTPMKAIDVTHNPELVHIRVSGTGITNLDLRQNPKLAAVYCSNTGISQLDLSGNPQMYELFCYNTPIEKLDLTAFAGLHTVECYQTNLKELDLSGNPELVGLNCSDTSISALDVSKNTKLQRLECKNTPIANLDLSANRQLRILNISNTNIANMKNLDLNGYSNLQELYCSNAGIESLDLTGCKELYSLTCENNQLAYLDLSQVGELWFEKNVSPQSKTVYASVENGQMILDMKQIVPQLDKVNVKESSEYSYDSVTGILTAEMGENVEVFYTYDHGYADLSPMEVKLVLNKSYKVAEGDETEIAKGNDLEIRIEGEGNVPGKVLIDGCVLSGDFYSIEMQTDGSVVVRVTQAYLDSLAEGKHSIQVIFNDGRSESSFVIKNRPVSNPSGGEENGQGVSVQNTQAPKREKAAETGDASSTCFWGILLCLSVALFWVGRKRMQP